MLQVTVNDKKAFSIIQEDGNFLIDDSAVDSDFAWQANGLISILYSFMFLKAPEQDFLKVMRQLHLCIPNIYDLSFFICREKRRLRELKFLLG